MNNKIIIVVFATFATVLAEQPYYLTECSRNDPDINTCLKNSANRLAKFLRQGVPELQINEVEPVVIDEIGISLGSGPDGYRASFRNIEAFGVSNLSVSNVKTNYTRSEIQPQIRFRQNHYSRPHSKLPSESHSGEDAHL